MSFAKLLTKYKRPFRVKAIADEIGVRRETIWHWVNGKLPQDIKTIELLANFFKLNKQESEEFITAAFPDEKYKKKDLEDVLLSKDFQAGLDELSNSNPPYKIWLTPINWKSLPFANALYNQARKRYPLGNTVHLQPPAGFSEDINEYFPELGKQFGWNNIQNSHQFEIKLKEKVQESTPLFLLISRLERCSPNLESALGKIIRSTMDEIGSSKLHLILWGSKKLAQLKSEPLDEHSLLSMCEDFESKPELGIEDVEAISYFQKNLDLETEDANEILRICGGHPELLLESIKLKKNNPNLSWEEHSKILLDTSNLWQLFSSVIKSSGDRDKLSKWLKHNQKHKMSTGILYNNTLLCRLYWNNVFKIEEGMLGWRCEIIREVGKQVVNSYSN
ncbi:helix-turn-helix transcriptional regulator [Candidatus Halobeggiatoa sp. HSG11]|nr:helix-turn-helix transcriptional regulator [Candidatus Halobeggiatoa sp. HSG11]